MQRTRQQADQELQNIFGSSIPMPPGQAPITISEKLQEEIKQELRQQIKDQKVAEAIAEHLSGLESKERSYFIGHKCKEVVAEACDFVIAEIIDEISDELRKDARAKLKAIPVPAKEPWIPNPCVNDPRVQKLQEEMDLASAALSNRLQNDPETEEFYENAEPGLISNVLEINFEYICEFDVKDGEEIERADDSDIEEMLVHLQKLVDETKAMAGDYKGEPSQAAARRARRERKWAKRDANY